MQFKLLFKNQVNLAVKTHKSLFFEIQLSLPYLNYFNFTRRKIQ